MAVQGVGPGQAVIVPQLPSVLVGKRKTYWLVLPTPARCRTAWCSVGQSFWPVLRESLTWPLPRYWASATPPLADGAVATMATVLKDFRRNSALATPAPMMPSVLPRCSIGHCRVGHPMPPMGAAVPWPSTLASPGPPSIGGSSCSTYNPTANGISNSPTIPVLWIRCRTWWVST